MSLKELVDGVAERIKDDIEGLTLTQPVKTYLWGAGGAGLDSVPAAVVQIPMIDRTRTGEREDHLGQYDIDLTFEVFFFFDQSLVDYTLPQAIETVTAFTEAIDDDITLGNLVEEAKVVHSEPTNVDSGTSRKLFGYSCTVEVEAFL